MKFAPLNVPLRRRLQTLAAVGWIFSLLVGGICGWPIYATIFYFFPILRIPMLLYLVWIYIDRDAGESGYRRSDSFRKSKWWQYLTEYFPMKLIKTADLSPEKNYIFATFPHGVLCFGAFCGFGADHSGFDVMYPGLRSHILILPVHFHTPIARELALTLGIRGSSASCIRRIFSGSKGEAVSLMVGGAKEAFFTQPGRYKMYVKDRKGFVRLALQTGASLVPVISFGEPELYDLVNTEGTIVRKFQDWIKNITGLAPLIFNGRGIFQYSFGFLPRRHPLFVVVGKAIDVEQTDSPSEEMVTQLHAKFVASLRQLFEDEKSKYLSEDVQLEIL